MASYLEMGKEERSMRKKRKTWRRRKRKCSVASYQEGRKG